MRITELALAGVMFAALPVALLFAPDHDFNSVVSAVEHRYSVHPQNVPFLWLANMGAGVVTRGGVRGMHIAEFDHIRPIDNTAELADLVTGSLGPSWQRVVLDREKGGNLDLIFVQPQQKSMRMLIASYDHDELDVIRMEVNGDKLREFIQHPPGQKHDGKDQVPGTAD